ncbi:aspartate/ornithine carbamoyltransferase/carbamoylphosphate-binding family protein [alpha proteobacterium HIMB59]|nr:aspartate/ornithine carbamoyltransferase/carbamoylphosphate-binding family protein [alpha proteobacterium HIMB59]
MKNLLNISDLSKDDFNSILSFASSIKPNTENCLKNKNIGLIFEKNSTRTRLSFQVGINQLQGKYIDIKLEELNLQRVESFEDTFEIMSCYLDALVFRTTNHEKLKLASKYFKKPIINALSDISHPCQAISDIYTLKEHFQKEDGFKIVWCGDLNNVLFSLLESMKYLTSSKIDIFTDKKIYEKNYENFLNLDNISYHFEIDDKILGSADCIMTDVFNSMNDKDDKESLLKRFMVDQELMNKTSDTAVFMHCLPAKIGSEVSNDVIKGSKSIVLKQAKNRMVAQRGIIKWLEL